MEGERDSFFFYFQSWLLYARRFATIILSYSFRRGVILEKTHQNKKREKLICVARMWQKRKLWRKDISVGIAKT